MAYYVDVSSRVKQNMRSMEPIVSCKQLSMQYGPDRPILHNVNFSLDHGSFHFLTGPSGAGKSTLLGLLSLSLHPSRGNIRMFGTDLSSLPHSYYPMLRRRVGMVFQDFRLLNHLTVAQNVALPLKIAGGDPIAIMHNVDEILDWIGMRDYAESFPQTLSGGQKQRVAIARAVVSKPDIILADEPTGNLDYNLSVKCMRLFEALHNQGTTIVIATHDDNMVADMGFPVLRLQDAQVHL